MTTRILRNAFNRLLATGLSLHAAWSNLSPRTKRVLWGTFKYLLAVGLLTYVSWSNWSPMDKEGNALPGLRDVFKEHFVQGKPIHMEFLLLAGVVASAAVLLTFVRWYILVRAVDLPFTLLNALRLGLIGFFFNIFMPGSVGGDIIKAAFIARGQSRRTVAVATVLLDRAIALWGLIWFVAGLGVLFWLLGALKGEVGEKLQWIVCIAAGIVGFTLFFCLVLAVLPERRARRFAGRLTGIPFVGHSAAEFWRAVWMYRSRPLSVVAALLLSLVGHVGFVLTFYFSARTLFEASQIPTLREHFLVVPIGMVVQAIPLFPGGAGIGEAGYGKLYELLKSPSCNGIFGSLVQRVVFWSLGLAGYLVYLRMRPTLQPISEPVDSLAAAEAS